MTKVALKDVKKGDYFKRKADAKTVFVRDEYDRVYKKFEAFDFEDINRFIFLKGSTQVYIDFEF
jgi:hypothetical protein